MKIKNIKNDQLFIKVICLITSVVLWVLVMVDTNPVLEKSVVNVPVTIKNISALEKSNMVLMNSDKDHMTVTVKVKGYGEQLNKIDKDDFTAFIDVLGFTEGTKNAQVQISGPNGVEIEDIYPAQIACKIESIVSRIMDVTVQYEGTQVDEFYVAQGVSNPTAVKITGPRSVVDSAKTAIATVNVEGVTETIIKTVPVRIYNGTSNEIFMSVPIENVEVNVPIMPTKAVDIVPTLKGEPAEGYDVARTEISPQKVRIAGSNEVLDKVDSLVLAELDISGANSDVSTTRKIINGNGLKIIGLEGDPSVKVAIEKIEEKVLTYKMDEIVFTNLQDGYDINILNKDAVVTVNVKGTTSEINNITNENLKLVADLSDVSMGMNNVKVVASTEQDIDSISLSDDTLKIEIVKSISDSQVESDENSES